MYVLATCYTEINPVARRRTENQSVGVYPPVSAEDLRGLGGGVWGLGEAGGGGVGASFLIRSDNQSPSRCSELTNFDKSDDLLHRDATDSLAFLFLF